MIINKKPGSKGRLFEMMEKVNKVKLNESYEDFNTPEDTNQSNSFSDKWSQEEIDAAKEQFRNSGINVDQLSGDEFDVMMSDYKNSHQNESLDNIEGGLADNKSPEDYDSEQLERGVNVEMEHTDDPNVALEIAMDHTEEDSNYYGNGSENPEDIAKKHAEIEAGELSEDNNVNNDNLVSGIRTLIDSVDESLGYKDLASAIAVILKEDYGTHNFKPFLMELQKHLNVE